LALIFQTSDTSIFISLSKQSIETYQELSSGGTITDKSVKELATSIGANLPHLAHLDLNFAV